MAEEMNTLVTYRGRLKGSLTRLLSYAEDPPEDCTYDSVVCRLERLEEVWRGFIQSTDELHRYRTQETFVDPEQDFDTYEYKYLAARGKLYALKTKYAPKPIECEQTTNGFKKLADQQAAFLQKISTTTPQKDNDLPKVNIPNFSGTYKY